MTRSDYQQIRGTIISRSDFKAEVKILVILLIPLDNIRTGATSVTLHHKKNKFSLPYCKMLSNDYLKTRNEEEAAEWIFECLTAAFLEINLCVASVFINGNIQSKSLYRLLG